jgi:hypothetical protein
MKSKSVVTTLGLLRIFVVSFVALAFSVGMMGSVRASDERDGHLHITKDCTGDSGGAGAHCTIATSNLAEIPAGSAVYYDQAAGTPTGLLDSNVILDAGHGDRAIGRCTLDFSTGLGLCTFSDGTGRLSRFTARVNVSFLGGNLWAWDGTYRFNPEADR